MIRWQHVSSAPVVLLFILFSLTFEPTSTSPVPEDKETLRSRYGPPSADYTGAQIQSTQGGDGHQVAQDEEEDELFKDVDPKTLAAVLLGALNKPQGKITSEGNKNGEEGAEKAEEVRDNEGADRDRDGHQELELVMAAAAAQGREEREREEDEERKRIEEEEERLTEKVTSHTTSQTVPVREPEAVTKEIVNKEGQQESERGTDGETEEQLNPEELKNLETMLKEFQSYSTATKRERDSSTGQRESRGEYLDYLDRNGLMNNEIKPKAKSYDLAMSKKKLKWQQEQEKDKNRPVYKGGNFMDDFNENLEDQEVGIGEDEEDEELLSPEEEEARAKAEQEEVRRQAAEAQRAKAEEEKLADIASDMVLQYMVKQDGKKYQNNNAAEDKRSEEDTDDDDDIDPQTIDKLIEISSKLHLPADDVVDIISDVEKKKKKDAPENLQWQRPLVPLSPPVAPSTILRTTPPSKPPKPNTNPFKAWFKDRASIKPSNQDYWMQEQWPFRTYPSYRFYQKPYSSYYPIYIPPPKSKPRYYAKPSYSFNDILGNSLDYDFDYPLKQRYRSWTQPRPRAPPAFRRNLYFPNYIVPQARTFQAVPMPKPRSPLRRRPAFYYPPPGSVVTRQGDYYSQLAQPQRDSDEELENFIKKVFLKSPQMFQ
ncbi:neurosecretory protein VGF [Astyanax mexicanus]|uniref:Neurosecretory protein VGF n=1 Tax=Astyanax mexicanus TaxID=7994 RepID=A0A8B9KSA3_ASTMX|nr:neurosecretory protein VGF [Astyanax mexicanus]